MKSSILVAALFALPVLAFGSACSSSDTSSATVSIIDLSPTPCAVTKTNSNQLTATATLPDGTKKDITTAAGVVWSTGNKDTATVSASGNVVGVNAGVVEIAATYQGAKGTASCTVTP